MQDIKLPDSAGGYTFTAGEAWAANRTLYWRTQVLNPLTALIRFCYDKL